MDYDAAASMPIGEIPKILQFDWYQDQEMHASIYIQNKLDKVISYKIKTNTPALYLVKPMQGQIYNKQKAKIIFKRKTLTKQQFQQNILNRLSKQKFQFNFSTSFTDAIGRDKTLNETEYMGVRFNLAKRQPQEVKIKRKKTKQEEKTQRELQQNIFIQKGKLLSVQSQREKQQEKLSRMLSSTQKQNIMNLKNVICLIVLVFILGLIL